jgi:hypothetical protein
MGAWEPVNGEGYRPGMERRGSNYHLHSTPYNHAITDDGRADCENGQRGYLRRWTSIPEERFLVQTLPEVPGVQGPTYAGRARVPRGQSFSREPLGRGHDHTP